MDDCGRDLAIQFEPIADVPVELHHVRQDSREKPVGHEKATMTDEHDRKRIMDRANRMLQQSKILRKMSDELLQESHDLRVIAKDTSKKGPRKSKPRQG